MPPPCLPENFMNKHLITSDDLRVLPVIAHVTGRTPEKKVWTELAVHYRAGHVRPFVAAVIGGVSDEARRVENKVPRLRTMAAGTLDRALNWFEESNLRDALLDSVPADAAVRFPDREQQRESAAVEKAIRDVIEHGAIAGVRTACDRAADDMLTPIKMRVVGITTDSVREAVTWLYPEPDLTDFALAKLMQRDFGIAERNVRNALSQERDGQPVTGVWVPPFLNAMKCFDRQLWQAGLATVTGVER